MEPRAQIEDLKKTNTEQTLTRVMLMGLGPDGKPTPIKLDAETGGIGGGGGVGTITGVTAGDGLTGGGTSGTVTLDVNVDNSTIEINTDALRVKDGGITNAKLALASVDYDNLSTANKTSLARKNLLYNPTFPIWQRGTSSPTTTDNTYGPDRWRLLLGAANAATIARSTDAPSGSKYCCALTVGSANNNKFGIFQVLEGVDCYQLRNQTVTLSAQLKATSGLSDIRMMMVDWTSTEDSVSGDPINSWNSGGTNPTLATNWAYGNTATNLGVTTSYARYSVTGIVGASATNVGVFIWCDDTSSTTTTDILKIGEVQLELSAEVTPFEQRPIQQELAMCQRYYEKSFALDTTPAQNTGSATGAATYRVQIGSTTAGFGVLVGYRVSKRTAASIIYYNPGASNTNWRNTSAGTDSGGASTLVSGENTFIINNPQVAGDSVSHYCSVHWSAAAEL